MVERACAGEVDNPRTQSSKGPAEMDRNAWICVRRELCASSDAMACGKERVVVGQKWMRAGRWLQKGRVDERASTSAVYTRVDK